MSYPRDPDEIPDTAELAELNDYYERKLDNRRHLALARLPIDPETGFRLCPATDPDSPF